MTKPLTHPDTSINIQSINLTAPARATATPRPTGIFQRVATWFWSHAEETSASDTSSFKGIL